MTSWTMNRATGSKTALLLSSKNSGNSPSKIDMNGNQIDVHLKQTKEKQYRCPTETKAGVVATTKCQFPLNFGPYPAWALSPLDLRFPSSSENDFLFKQQVSFGLGSSI